MKAVLCCLTLLVAVPASATLMEDSLCRMQAGPVPVEQMVKSEKLCRAFVRSLGELPGETMKEVEALLSPESMAALGAITAAWVGTQGVPVVGQVVDAALLVVGVAMAAAQTAAVKDSVWKYVKYATEATHEEGLNQAASHLARAVATVGVTVVTFILTKKVSNKLGPQPGPPAPPPTLLPEPVPVLVGGPVGSTAGAIPGALSEAGVVPAVAMAGVRSGGGRTPPKAPAPKKVDAKSFKQWLDKAERRPAREQPEAYAYQKKHAGPDEILVSGGGEQVWADGARTDTARLVEAKHVGQPDKSPFIAGSQCEDWLRLKIEKDVAGEFRRYAAVINDPSTPATFLEVIVNDARAVPYFEGLLRRFGIPGEVVVRP